MTIYQIFLHALQESGEIICLRSWAWEKGIDYKNAHLALYQAKRAHPKAIKIKRLRNEQGRPLYVKWLGE
jgi:hypothetical protein